VNEPQAIIGNARTITMLNSVFVDVFVLVREVAQGSPCYDSKGEKLGSRIMTNKYGLERV
jgi:hypothetical protein